MLIESPKIWCIENNNQLKLSLLEIKYCFESMTQKGQLEVICILSIPELSKCQPKMEWNQDIYPRENILERFVFLLAT